MLSLEYIAGFIDGEGCITLTKRYKIRKNGARHVEYQPVLVVSNTHRGILEGIKKRLSGKIVVRKAKERHKASYHLRLGNKQCYEAMEMLREHLILKKRQAILILEFRSKMRSLGYGDVQKKETIVMLDNMMFEFRKLNKRGVET